MAQTNLPEVLDTLNNLPEVLDKLNGVMSYDKGNVFDKSFFFPKRAEKRIDTQKEIILHMMDINGQVRLAHLGVEKEISLAQMQYSYELQKMKYQTLCQLIEGISGCDLTDYNEANDCFSSRLKNVGDILSKF